jgi:hypothetical protein
MELPSLPRQPLRPDKEKSPEDREIWQPSWKCYCCQDTGLVASLLVRLVIVDYSHQKDKSVVCKNPNCELGNRYVNDNNYDQRFTSAVCVKLDAISREDWRNTAKIQQERIKEFKKRTKELALKMNLRSRDRTPEEEELARRKHEEVLNADPEQLWKEARDYLGDEFMKYGST